MNVNTNRRLIQNFSHKKWELSLIFLFFIFCLFFYLYVLTKDPLIYGEEGPYYLIQVKHVLETLQIKYGDSPLSFYVFSLFGIFLGNVILGVKVATAIFSALTSIPVYFFTKKITCSRPAGCIAMISCSLLSSHIMLFNGDFKSSISLFLFAILIYITYDFIVDLEGRKCLLLCIACWLMIGVTNVQDFFVALIYLVIYTATAFLIFELPKSVKKNIETLLCTGIIFIFLASFIFEFYFVDFIYGVNRMFGVLLAYSPMARQTRFFGIQDASRSLFYCASKFLIDPKGGIFILPALAVGVLLTVYEWKNEKKREVVALTSITTLGLSFLIPFAISPLAQSIGDILWNLIIRECIPVSLIAGYAFSKLLHRTLYFTVLLMLFFPSMLYQAFETVNYLRPVIDEEDYREIQKIGEYVPQSTAIITNLHLRYWVEYILNIPVFTYPFPELWFKYESIMLLTDRLSHPQIPIPENATEIYNGSRLLLYKLR